MIDVWILFLVRVFSAISLLAFIVALFYLLWRDYRSAGAHIRTAKQAYGRLVGLTEIDGRYNPNGEVYPLLPNTTIGRAPTNTIRINDEFASNDHAVVALRHGVWWLEDNQSRNGTNLNSIQIEEPVIVTHGDIINIGTQNYQLELEQR